MRAAHLWMLTVAAAGAQTINVESLFEPAPLAGIWKHHAGDNPHWASPAFDDSDWPGVRMPEGAVEPDSGFSWYRFHLHLPETMPKEPLALMIGGFGNGQAYEVFWNGQRVGVVGEPEGSLGGLLLPAPRALSLPGQARDGIVAIRLRAAGFPYASRLDAMHRTSWIGTRHAMEASVEAWQDSRLRRALPNLLIAASLMTAAAFFLAFPLWRRDAPEYFWFGVWLSSLIVVRVQASYPVGVDTSLTDSWSRGFAVAAAYVGWVGVLRTLFHGRVTRVVFLGAVPGILMFWAPVVFVMAGGSVPVLFSTIPSLANLAGLGVTYYELGWRTSRAKEGMPAIHVAILAYLMSNLVFFSGAILWRGEAFWVQGNLIRTVALLLFTFAMAILMNQRSARLLGERQRLGREMESAAEVQSLLLTSLPAAVDAYHVDPVYLPASEVGGDFYHVRSFPDGSQVALVGDVSGKGLKAAMVVSACIGSLQREDSSSPAAILAGLNRTLAGRVGGGFATCCCVQYRPGGVLTVASAGHPAPWIDGQEVVLSAGLPLGVVAAAEFAETSLHLAVGQQITIVSDGVVEAENAQRELFGFHRTGEISTKAAREIADAARLWGQNDDITVVTVRRMA